MIVKDAEKQNPSQGQGMEQHAGGEDCDSRQNQDSGQGHGNGQGQQSMNHSQGKEPNYKQDLQGEQGLESDTQSDRRQSDVRLHETVRMRNLMKKDPTRVFTAFDVSMEARVPIDSVYTFFSREFSKDKLEKIDKGRYRLRVTATIPPLTENEVLLGHNFLLFYDPDRGVPRLTTKLNEPNTPIQQPLPGLDSMESERDGQEWETVFDGKDRSVKVKPGLKPQVRIKASRSQLSGEVLDWVLELVSCRYGYDFETGPWWAVKFEAARDFENLRLEGVQCVTYNDLRSSLTARAYNKTMPGGEVLRVEAVPKGAVLLRDLLAFFRGEGMNGGLSARRAEEKASREEIRDTRREVKHLSTAVRSLLDTIHAEAPRPRRKEDLSREQRPASNPLKSFSTALEIFERKGYQAAEAAEESGAEEKAEDWEAAEEEAFE